MQMKKDQECYDCKYNKNKILENNNMDENNISANELSISIAQAKFLVSIGNRMLNGAEMSIGTKFYVRDNWGDPDHFKKLCFSDEPNQLSLIIHFLKIKDELKKNPTKEEMDNKSKFSIKQFEKKFGSWSNFLNLVGEDPWYRDQKKRRTYYKKSKTYEEQLQEIKKSRINSKQKTEDNKKEIKMKLEELEEKLNKNEKEVFEGLENIKNTIEMELKDNTNALKKFKDLEKFTDLLSLKKIQELEYSV